MPWTLRAPVCLVTALAGCTAGPPTSDDPPWGATAAGPPAFELDLGAFSGAGSERPVFSMVVGDADGDADLDVMLNRHHLDPLELYLDGPDGLARANIAGADSTGLYDNPGVPSLYGEEQSMLDAALAGPPGLSVWHDLPRAGVWHLVAHPGDGVSPAVRVTANRALTDIEGVGSSEIERLDVFSAELTWADPTTAQHVTVANALVGTQLIVEVIDSEPIDVFVGRERSPATAGTLSLWKPDPHGLAWHDVIGDPQPELFVTRGGLMGRLEPPHEPKVDRWFVGEGPGVWDLDVDAVPASYGRGRQLQWVDLDGDRVDELVVGNSATPNSVLALGSDGRFVDVAAGLGLDLHLGDAFAWIDVDGDTWPDQVTVEGTELWVVRSLAGAGFVREPGPAWGLVSPASAEDALDGLFDPFTFSVADLDNDGRLDLWLSGWGTGERVAVFLATDGGFRDATAELGLDSILAPDTSVVLTDVDADGWTDAVLLSAGVVLAHRGPDGFELDADWADWPVADTPWVGVAADLDEDGLEEVVGAAGPQRFVAWNRTEPPRPPLTVTADLPLGTVVVAVDSVKDRTAYAWGSQHSSRYSQSVLPVQIGSRPGVRVQALQWTEPGGQTGYLPVRPGDRNIHLSR